MGLFNLEKRRLCGDLVTPYSTEMQDGKRHFRRARSDRIKGNGFNLMEGRFKLDIRKKLITIKVVRNRLLGEIVKAHSQKYWRPSWIRL